ncbi:MAG: regulatory protein RecX [Victivallaceae bacterium]|nr:regulatory protein RecX [Victivallaceae bacterium]
MDESEQKLFDRALRLLSTRAHGVRELRTKLLRGKEPPPENTVDAVVAECLRLGFLNDVQFARDCAAELAGRGCGDVAIRFKLKARGLAPDDIAAAMIELAAESPGGEAERAMAAGKFKLKSLKKDEPERKKREKLFRFLAGRGFRGETVREVLRRLLSDSDFDDIL